MTDRRKRHGQQLATPAWVSPDATLVKDLAPVDEMRHCDEQSIMDLWNDEHCFELLAG
jgi:hypothetical protein